MKHTRDKVEELLNGRWIRMNDNAVIDIHFPNLRSVSCEFPIKIIWSGAAETWFLNTDFYRGLCCFLSELTDRQFILAVYLPFTVEKLIDDEQLKNFPKPRTNGFSFTL